MAVKIITTLLVIALLLGVLLVSGAGCGGKEVSAEDLNSDLENLENMNDDINNLDLEMNDTELGNIEDFL